MPLERDCIVIILAFFPLCFFKTCGLPANRSYPVGHGKNFQISFFFGDLAFFFPISQDYLSRALSLYGVHFLIPN